MREFTSDKILFEAFKNDDAGAVTVIFDRFFRSLCLLAENITEDTMAAEDIVAEAFVKMYQKRIKFEGMDNLKSFLFVVVRNNSLTHNTTRKRHKTAHDQIGRFLPDNHIPENTPLHFEIMRAEILEKIYLDIENLPLQCRRISKMIFLEGKTTQEVAAALSISPDTVRVQKARAVKMLKNQLFKDPRFVPLVLLILSEFLFN